MVKTWMLAFSKSETYRNLADGSTTIAMDRSDLIGFGSMSISAGVELESRNMVQGGYIEKFCGRGHAGGALAWRSASSTASGPADAQSRGDCGDQNLLNWSDMLSSEILMFFQMEVTARPNCAFA